MFVLVVLIPILAGVAWLTVVERKILGGLQRRRGPYVVGLYGLFQALADALKLVAKESGTPTSAAILTLWLAPIVRLVLSFMLWTPLVSPFPLSLLLILAVRGLSVLGLIIAGWSSNSKLAFLGGLRSSAQIIRLEVSLAFFIITIGRASGSLQIDVVYRSQTTWYMLWAGPLMILLFVTLVAETNRHPFDLPEAEAELVSGLNVDLSAIGFTLFFLAELSAMLVISILITILFCGSSLLRLKALFWAILLVLLRGALPRLRLDQLMAIGWKGILPISLMLIAVVPMTLMLSNGIVC